MGKKYTDVLPGIYSGDADAVLAAMRRGRGRTLRGHGLNSLSGSVKADITIRPLKGGNGRVSGAEITIAPEGACPSAEEGKNAQRLMDIGKMATTLAHGVRNPLNAIKGAVIYIREKYPQEPTLAEFTKLMEEEITKLDAFISRFLSSSVTDAEYSETDVNALIRKVETITSLQARMHGIATEFTYGQAPGVMINPFQLEHAVLNVMNNAMDAMASGGRLAVRTCEGLDGDRRCVVIEVSDTGPGMSQSRINSTRLPEATKGRGYGLFITREILQYYGGRLEINSDIGRGTVVRLYVPAKTAE